MKLLISNGALLNIQDHLKRTPLHYAINDDNQEIAKILLENGADYDIKDFRNITPFDIAKTKDNLAIVECIGKQLEKEVLQKIQNNPKPLNVTLDDCVVCYNQRMEIHVLYPCGHAKICKSCCFRILHLSRNESTCPVCRCEVIDYKKVFF